MNLQTEKLNLIQSIIALQDKDLVLELKKHLDAALAQKGSQLKPMSTETFYAKIAASEKAMEEGKYTSHEDLKKQVKTWGREK